MHKSEIPFFKEYYKVLEGATIMKTALVPDEHDEYIVWPTLTIKLASGEVLKVEVSQDPEGNSEGFLFGLPMPQQVAQ